jgi:twitching motility protein PilT
MIDKLKTARGEKVTDIEGRELDHEYERKTSLF